MAGEAGGVRLAEYVDCMSDLEIVLTTLYKNIDTASLRGASSEYVVWYQLALVSVADLMKVDLDKLLYPDEQDTNGEADN